MIAWAVSGFVICSIGMFIKTPRDKPALYGMWFMVLYLSWMVGFLMIKLNIAISQWVTGVWQDAG